MSSILRSAFFGDTRFRLAVVIVGIVPAFALTFVVVGRFKTERAEFARQWAERGDRDMARSPSAAVVDFQTALAYRPDDPSRRLGLAEALIASGAPREARAHLLTLWAQEPGDGRVNLDLARLAAADGDVTEATRYYHAAIDGAWETHAATARRGARIEAAKLLLQQGQPVHAQAELIALIGDLPPDPALLTDVGRLLVAAGAESRSIPLFERALTVDRRSALASQLEGEVQFRARHYPIAHRLLSEARHNGATFTEADELMLATSARIPDLDPLAERLSASVRLTRALEGLAIARRRLARCQANVPQPSPTDPVADLQHRADAFDKLSRRALARDPDRTTDMITLTAQIEALPATTCGPDTTDDAALRQIAIDHQLQTQ